MLRTISFLILVLCLHAPAHAGHPRLVAEPPDASIVNLTGEQRMLSQRIVKAYAQIGLDVMPAIAQGQRAESIKRFEDNLQTLASHVDASLDATIAHENLVRAWQAFRSAAEGPVSRDAALVLSRQSLAMLDGAAYLTKLIEDASHDSESALVNEAGKLRMLSQRLAKAYLLLSWGIQESEVREELDTTVKLFAERLAWLIERPENTLGTRLELEEIELQWSWLQTAIMADGSMSYRLVVVEAADSITGATEHLTRLYEQINRR